ncbi:von Willebrand factor D and EGF domain-containing protein-like isoform X1 [Pomacea canaliculata]|uniref:von Willebrand factor D and EGF domain-containing protein-like isoform X1 n=1 Tax=Pomacea canaliculata TaxID=400727 RepID=UPI000D73B7E4|nr:von Willebrand factor D and EGF domain-containing protein-like isoform X1 [Pomacea canaliculata]
MGCEHTTKWFLPSLLLALAALYNVAAQAMPDPCLDGNYKNLTDVHRSVSYVTTYPEPPLCDIDLVAGWYRFVVDAESKMPETCVDTFKCGTTVPIWLNGTHPSVSDGIQTRRACANLQTGGTSNSPCCGQAVNIGVKNCGGFYVYYLHPTPACPMAYCAGKDAPCPAGKWSPTGFPPNCKDAYPQLTDPPRLRGPVIERNTFYFTCDLTFSGNDPDQAFEFVWLFNGLEDPKVPPEVVSDPGRSARLDGAQLTGLLNKNVGCKVRAYYKQNAIKKGPWLTSARTYWAGIQTNPSQISIRTDEEKFDVVIRSTLPVLCSSTLTDDKCCLWILLLVNGSQWDQDFLSTPTDCKYSLCKSNWNSTSQEVSRTVSVVASKIQMQDGTKNLLVSFTNIVVADLSPYQRIFQGLKIPSVQVNLQQRESKLCHIVTDPHITGIEDQRTFHLYRAGDYTAYINDKRHFEVQFRTWPCYKERPDRAVTCICGVAVREKDDLIRVNGCDHGFYGQSVGSPEITVPRRLREGTTILQSTDGSTITLYFPSSSEIQITASAILGGHLNLYISIPGTDYLKGRGLCGTFDNNTNNDLTHRSGFVDTMPADHVPVRFTESWKNDDSTSLFRIVPPETKDSYVPKYCTCNNDVLRTVNCTYQGDIKGRKLTCPHCLDTTKKSSFHRGRWWYLKRKRSVSDETYVDSDEMDQEYDPNDYADFQPPKLSWPTSTGINESQAENYCSTALRQSQLWSHCQDRTQEIQGLIENCKIDILVADNYTGTEVIVDTFLTICKVELAKNPDNYVTTPSGESVVKPEISDDVCNPVCYINGRCDRGRCVCNRGFIGDNCQIKDEPPKLLGIRGSELCDFNERPCQQVFINAENIQNTETMACKIQEILDDKSVSERASMEEAVFLTLNKLGCVLPDAGIKTETSIKRFYITATIDGDRYSNAVNMTVYDSSCQSCTQKGCWKLPDTCLISNLCFQDGELNPNNNSQVCNVSASTTEWSLVHTVLLEYPAIMSVIVRRSEDNTQLRCEVNADASKPTASFRMAWGVDGDWLQESVMSSGHLEAVINVSDISHVKQVTCRARSKFTDSNVFSPYTYSNPLSMIVSKSSTVSWSKIPSAFHLTLTFLTSLGLSGMLWSV